MSLTQRLGPFRGLNAATAGDAPPGFAGSIRNVRVGDGRILPRYGFKALAPSPPKLQAVVGLARLVGYGDDYAERREWVSVEKRDGTIKPYAIDPATWARTEITNAGTPLTLASGDWLAFSFGGTSYWINPGGATSVYRHEVGDVTSWTALQDSAYVPTGDAASITPSIRLPDDRSWNAANDSFSASTYDFTTSTTFAVDANGSLLWQGAADDHSQVGTGLLMVEFVTPLDLSEDYFALTATGGDIINTFASGTYVKVRVAGTMLQVKPEQKEFISADKRSVTVVVRMKGFAGANSIDQIEACFYSNPYHHTTGTAFTILPLRIGGTYVNATASGDRPWDATYLTADVAYGVRYRNLSTGDDTGILTSGLASVDFGRTTSGASCPLGDQVLIALVPQVDGVFVDDPAGTTCVMDVLRTGSDDKWRLLTTLPNTTGQSCYDRREGWEVDALASLSDNAYATPTPAPVFSSQGFVGAVPFKGWVVWLRAGGYQNVQHSAVGNAESLYSENDSTDEAGRGENFTLADDGADEPLGGVQAGDALLVLGRRGAYSQSGNSPATMTPFRKLPGSIGGAGRFAFARFREPSGVPGLAWLDPSGENVWFASAALAYATDAQARPSELSEPIRGSVRTFLLTEQLADFSTRSLADARMDVDEATGSLWLVLGARAAVLRPPSLVDGQRQWEFHEFALGAWTPYVPGRCLPPYSSAAFASLSRAASTLVWSNPQGAQSGADVASAGGFVPGLSSQWLSGTFVPESAIPGDATVVRTELTVTHRATSTGAVPTSVVLSAVGVGTSVVTPSQAVPSSFADFEVDLSSLGLTPAALNAGVPIGIAYDATPADPTVYDADHWSFDEDSLGRVVPENYPGPFSSPTTHPIVATYVGRGSAPSVAPIRVRSISAISGPFNVPGNVVLDNGQGTVVTGTIPNPPTVQPGPADGTVEYGLPVSNGVARKTITVTRSNTNTPAGEGDFGYGAVYASVVPPDPTTVEVQAVTLTVCYVTSGTASGALSGSGSGSASGSASASLSGSASASLSGSASASASLSASGSASASSSSSASASNSASASGSLSASGSASASLSASGFASASLSGSASASDSASASRSGSASASLSGSASASNSASASASGSASTSLSASASRSGSASASLSASASASASLSANPPGSKSTTGSLSSGPGSLD